MSELDKINKTIDALVGFTQNQNIMIKEIIIKAFNEGKVVGKLELLREQSKSNSEKQKLGAKG